MENLREGERVKPSFFRRMKSAHKQEEIFSLMEDEEEGTETQNTENMKKIAKIFYSDLWKNRRLDGECSERRMRQLLKKVKRKVGKEKKKRGERPLELEEFKTVTRQLLKNKSPGIDGIPAEFYQTFDFALEWLFRIVKQLLKEKKMTNTMSTSIVKLLFKKGDRRNIGNYRPLSLACTDYKIIAKVISERIKPMLTDIIGTEKQGFIQGGDITGNLMLVKEIIEYCTETNTEAFVIMMD